MGARCDADINVLVEVAVKVATDSMHCRVELGLELNALVAIVVDLSLLVRVGEFEAEFFFGNSTMIVEKNNI